MPSADDRIVSMKFDNADFERKIASTIKSLADLNKSLQMTGATKGLTDLGAAAKGVDLSPMGEATDGISKKFIALSTIAITALVAITSQAIHAGAQVAKAFTVQPLIDGFREYETQLNSVQTILANTASKGTTLDQVNDALQRLNTYSDQTIYNFGQMARNIGTFTAAGVDLDTSVNAIKGIANLAAMSGSSSEQASTAMYQLSQAIATGSLKLMDWNSVVNAGMGGEAFKSALFETAKAMGNTLNVPVGQTFKEWEDAGNSFRDTLQDGWVTADILTTTLSTFTGDMTEEMLLQKGFTEQQAQGILKTAQIAKAAATEVKTFTQLVGTVKEAVGTGWADTFKIIIGNFNQAKELWTGVNNAIGSFVSKNADARNAILAGWEAFGGRTSLIDSLKDAFHNLFAIIAPIKEAFQNIFPPMTSQRLLELTDGFGRLVDSLKPSQTLIDTIRITFQGFFSVLSIGWTIIKEGAKFLLDLGKSLLGLVSPEVGNFLVKLGLALSDLQGSLVKGGKIKEFFEDLTKALQKPIEWLHKFKDAISNIFDGFSSGAADAVTGSVDRLSDRFAGLKEFFSSLGDIWQPLENGLRRIVDALGRVADFLGQWLKDLWKNLADVMGPGDFNAFLDAINTGLFAGLIVLLKKFFNEGLKFDLGGGLFEKVSGILDQVTGSLKAMQLNVKANAILKIAGAIAILTASVLLLSTIDSGALTKALGAMAVGFTQLMASFSVFTKIVSTPAGAASFTILSAGLILLSTALLILSGVVKIFSGFSWEELAKGLGGVSAMIGILVVATKPLAANSKGMIVAGVGITALAIALTILTIPIKIFSKMKWEEIGKGLATVAGALLIIAGAMQLMPTTLPITAAGLIGVAFALTLLMAPMKVFSKMRWEEIGKGLASIAGALLIIAGAMQLMPATLPITAAGLVLVGVALGEIAVAMKLMGKMKWDEIGRGLTVLAGSLIVLAAGLYAMTGSIAGAAALLIASNALLVLAAALKVMGKMSFDDILDALLKIAIALAAFALISVVLNPAIGAMLALGAALVVLGAGFALVGAGAYLIAKALETFGKAGSAAVDVVGELLEALGEGLPKLIKGLAKGIVDMVLVFAKAAPIFADALGKLIVALLDELTTIIPKAVVVMQQLIDAMITLIYNNTDKIIAAGFYIIERFLEGVKNNIGPITTAVADIIVNFVNAISAKLDEVVGAVGNLFRTFFLSVAYELGKTASTLLVGVGKAFVQGFLDGVEEQAPGITEWFQSLPGKILDWIGNVLGTLVNKGSDLIHGLLNGLINTIGEVIGWLAALPGNILTWVGDTASTLLSKGFDVIEGLFRGITGHFSDVIGWLSGIPGMIAGAITGLGDLLFDKGVRVIEGFWHGMMSVIDDVTSWVEDKVSGIADAVGSVLGINSPSKVFMGLGSSVGEGFLIGIQDSWEPVDKWLDHFDPTADVNNKMAENMARTVNAAIQRAVAELDDNVNMSPVITPIIDLTNVREGANQISSLMPVGSTYNHAQTIASERVPGTDTVTAVGTGGDVRFEQIINSPTQLSVSDIYKNTRNQIALAKEELSIP